MAEVLFFFFQICGASIINRKANKNTKTRRKGNRRNWGAGRNRVGRLVCVRSLNKEQYFEGRRSVIFVKVLLYDVSYKSSIAAEGCMAMAEIEDMVLANVAT